MQLREPLVEKLLRFFARRGDFEVDILGPLTGHQMSRERGRRSAGRRHAQIRSLRLRKRRESSQNTNQKLLVMQTDSTLVITDKMEGMSASSRTPD